MNIRTATIHDLDAITAAEAASKKDFEARLKAYPNHFWSKHNPRVS